MSEWRSFFAEAMKFVVLLACVGGAVAVSNIEVDGSKAACEAAHPGRACKIVWAPKP